MIASAGRDECVQAPDPCNTLTWGVRAGAFQVARRVNSLFMDPGVTRAWQVIGQVDRFYQINSRPGAVRVIYGASRTRQSSWGELFEICMSD